MRLIGTAVAAAATLTLVACKHDDITRIRSGTVFVAARDSFFTPDTITVSVGLPVRWTNEGRVYHTVVIGQIGRAHV